jgi:hypothetical protein
MMCTRPTHRCAFALCRRIGSFVRRLTGREARNYFRHAGYAQNRSESALARLSALIAASFT